MVTRDSQIKTVEERFWDRVRKTDGCWFWTGRLDENGYGTFTPIRNRSCLAHRFAYALLVGPIPEGLHLDHVRARGCANRHCVNPAHLEPVTGAENNRRGWLYRLPVEQCKHGHPLSGPNLRVDPRGWRVCRTCARQRMASARWAKREEQRSAI